MFMPNNESSVAEPKKNGSGARSLKSYLDFLREDSILVIKKKCNMAIFNYVFYNIFVE